MISPQEREQLDALAADLVQAQQSPWEPTCIARAFTTPASGTIALTMQGWIDLSAVKSSLLHGGLPETVEELAAAADAFALDVKELSPSDCVKIAQAMLRACTEAFAAGLIMEQPTEAPRPVNVDDGFGEWLPIWAFLVSECGIDPDAALQLRVDRAHMLLAATRRNQGWKVAGAPYAQRDVIQPVEEIES